MRDQVQQAQQEIAMIMHAAVIADHRRAAEILRLSSARGRQALREVYRLPFRDGGEHFIAEIVGGAFADMTEDGLTYRVIVDGREPSPHVYLTPEHAVLAASIARSKHSPFPDAYAAGLFAARAFGVPTGISDKEE